MLPRVGNLRARLQDVLSTSREDIIHRDSLLQDVEACTRDDACLIRATKDLTAASNAFGQFSTDAIRLTRSVEFSAHIAEASSSQVKRLDILLSRIQDTKTLVDCYIASRAMFADIQRFSVSKDVEKVCKAIETYTESRHTIRQFRSQRRSVRRETGHVSDEWVLVDSRELDENSANEEDFIVNKKVEIVSELRRRLEDSMHQNHTSEVHRLLRLALSVDAKRDVSTWKDLKQSPFCCLYIKWICDRSLVEISSLVDGELQTLETGKNTECSHLASASAALDHVVASLEQEESFVSEIFGTHGFHFLLFELHNQCTHHVVRIIKDFLRKRKSSFAEKTLPAKRIDETLDEIAHLVSCCHIYMQYVDERYKTALSAASSDAVSGDRSALSTIITEGNPLFESINDLLATFIQLQREYFTVTLRQIVAQQRQSQGASQADTAQPRDRTAEIMNAVGFSRNAVATSTTRGQAEESQDITLVEDVFYIVRVCLHRAFSTQSTIIASAVVVAILEMTIPDLAKEVFSQFAPAGYKLLQSSPQTLGPLYSAAASAKAGTTGARLFASLQASQNSFNQKLYLRCLLEHSGDVGSVLSLGDNFKVHSNPAIPSIHLESSLKWSMSAFDLCLYSRKLGGDVEQLTRQQFQDCRREASKFRELYNEVNLATFWLEENTKDIFATICNSIADEFFFTANMQDAMRSSSFLVSESDFREQRANHCLMLSKAVPTWQDFCHRVASILQYRDDIFACFLHNIVVALVRGMESCLLSRHPKSSGFTIFGGLLLDKDVREAKNLFLSLSEGLVPVREEFARLSAMTAILVIDDVSEAASIMAPLSMLSESEQNIILSLRVDL